MKVLQNILSVVLVVTFLNVIIGKSVHEFFEHDHVAHACISKDVNHFHEFEFQHSDFICEFVFSISTVTDGIKGLENFIHYQDIQINIRFLHLVKNLCIDTLSLRGPPQF